MLCNSRKSAAQSNMYCCYHQDSSSPWAGSFWTILPFLIFYLWDYNIFTTLLSWLSSFQEWCSMWYNTKAFQIPSLFTRVGDQRDLVSWEVSLSHIHWLSCLIIFPSLPSGSRSLLHPIIPCTFLSFFSFPLTLFSPHLTYLIYLSSLLPSAFFLF